MSIYCTVNTLRFIGEFVDVLLVFYIRGTDNGSEYPYYYPTYVVTAS